MNSDTLWSSRIYLATEIGLDEKLAAQLGKQMDLEQAKQLCALTPDAMAQRLSSCLVEIEKAKREVSENEGYQAAKQAVKDFDDALKDKVNPLKATVSLLVHLLDS